MKNEKIKKKSTNKNNLRTRFSDYLKLNLIKSRRRRKLRSCLLFADANIETLSLVCSFSPKMLAFLEVSCVWSREAAKTNVSAQLFAFKKGENKQKCRFRRWCEWWDLLRGKPWQEDR